MNIVPKEKIFLAVAFALMVVWTIYFEFFASSQAINFITRTQLDKIMHVLGGTFIAGLLLVSGRRGLSLLLVMLITLSILWETGEFFFDSQTSYFFYKNKALWLEDTLADFAAALAGSLIYWRIRIAGRASF